MNVKNQHNKQKGSRWLRAGLLTFTLAGPVINAVAERIRERTRVLHVQATTLQDNAQTIQASARRRLDQLVLESRQRFAEQAKQLQQLQAQTKRLRKTLRKNVKRRRKLVRKLRRSGADWRQAMLKRSGGLTANLADRGKQAWEASSRLTQDLVKRGGKLTDELTGRGSEATQRLTRSGSRFAQDLAERSEHLLQPARKRNRNLWTILGFGIGLVVAGVTTYLFVRRRVIQHDVEEGLPIELPQSGNRNGARGTAQSPPERNLAGEILLVVDDDNGTAVVTLPVVDVEKMQRPADAAFVGVASTRFYYPAETPLEEKDLVYFASEEEAREQGFTAAQ